MDWNTIIVVATIWAITAIAGRLWVCFIRPWLDQHHLNEAATIAVQAAEALVGRYHGEDKLRNVMDQLASVGFNVDSQIVIDAVLAAWQRLNMDMISAGIKKRRKLLTTSRTSALNEPAGDMDKGGCREFHHPWQSERRGGIYHPQPS